MGRPPTRPRDAGAAAEVLSRDDAAPAAKEFLHRTGRNVGLCSPARERRDFQRSRHSRGGLKRSCLPGVRWWAVRSAFNSVLGTTKTNLRCPKQSFVIIQKSPTTNSVGRKMGAEKYPAAGIWAFFCLNVSANLCRDQVALIELSLHHVSEHSGQLVDLDQNCPGCPTDTGNLNRIAAGTKTGHGCCVARCGWQHEGAHR